MWLSLWKAICALVTWRKNYRTWKTNEIILRWNQNRTVSISDENWFLEIGIHYAKKDDVRRVIELALQEGYTNSVLRHIKAAQERGYVFRRYRLDGWFRRSKIENGDHMQSRLNLAYHLHGPLIPLNVFAECIANAVEIQLLQTEDYETRGLAKDEPTFATIWREQNVESRLHIADLVAKKGFFLLLQEMYTRIGEFKNNMPREIALECLKTMWPQDGIDLEEGVLLTPLATLVNLSFTHKTKGRELAEAILAVDRHKFTSDMWDTLKILALPLLLEGAVNFAEPVECFGHALEEEVASSSKS